LLHGSHRFGKPGENGSGHNGMTNIQLPYTINFCNLPDIMIIKPMTCIDVQAQ
jgi:hypothetical protein